MSVKEVREARGRKGSARGGDSDWKEVKAIQRRREE